MLPANLDSNIKIIKYPSETYKLDFEKTIIQQNLKNVESLKQSIYCTLKTERFRHLIYSKNYGINLQDLYGKPVRQVLPTIERRIKEALIVDDRINTIYDFSFEIQDRNIVLCSFKVGTDFGILEIMEVEFNV